MLNDVVGDEPVTLTYCTLCGSAILYSTRTPAGGARSFGTSGLLYRSNKLMYDRESYSLWSNLTGEPVVGRLAASPIRLQVLPMTLTTWREWRSRHPGTRVLDLKAIKRDYGRRFGFDYRAGAADRARSGVAFPVWLKNHRLKRDDEVYALRWKGATKAYPLDLVLQSVVVNDGLGGDPLVLVADRASGAVRAYLRSSHTFSPGGQAGALRDEQGRLWWVKEHELRLEGGEGEDATLERLPGHVAFWFGWYAFYPDTEVYAGSGDV